MTYLPKCLAVALVLTVTQHAFAQTVQEKDSIGPYKEQQVKEVEVVTRRAGRTRMLGAVNGSVINKEELFKAACCNLGESFVTNPSADVSYSDATTGAKQIKLLGLSGTYVQMLTENIPNFRGAALPYALGYVPGPWMKSIQVSTGLASVKNGYESVTGQINVEYLDPKDPQGIAVNLYGNSKSRFEANADANLHLNSKLSTELLLHYDDNWGNHDDNHDGFLDQPKVRQYNLQNRWAYMGNRYIFHGGLSFLKENRTGGQTTHTVSHSDAPLYGIGIETNRYEAYMKHAFVLNPERGENIAFLGSATMHEQNALYGTKAYNVNEKNLYAQLVYETTLAQHHNLSTGLSLNHDYFGQRYLGQRIPEKETTWGGYAQYTYNMNQRLVAMAGLRVDHSNLYGTFATPRVHLKWQVNDIWSLRLSAGKGYRTAHALAENNYLMASGRKLVIDQLKQESAWTYGLNNGLLIPIGNKTLRLNAEYYFTNFDNQAVIDYDTDPHTLHITNLHGRSFSHTFQIDGSYPLFEGFELSAAWRWNDVKTTYNGRLMRKPLTNRYKALVSGSYKTPLGLWQFDATLQLNGGGRMPEPYTPADGSLSWNRTFGSYAQLTAQVTRWFRNFSIYVGGENLTGFQQKTPIIAADRPWSSDFEPTLVWGPVHGPMVYAGIRINIGKL